MLKNMFEKAISSLWTNLGPMSVDLIFLHPQCCKFWFFEDSTEFGILVPRKPMSEN